MPESDYKITVMRFVPRRSVLVLNCKIAECDMNENELAAAIYAMETKSNTCTDPNADAIRVHIEKIN